MTESEQSLPAEKGSLSPSRYAMLDAWRGFAALAVVLHHAFNWIFGAKGVILFFVISGYCISAASNSARRNGLGFGGFMWRRMKRIYPPYLLAILYFVVTRIIKMGSDPAASNQLSRPLMDWVQNLTLTQWFTTVPVPVADPPMNPTNFLPVFWSLQYEEQFYLLMALILPIAVVLRATLASVLVVVSIAWLMVFPQVFHGIFYEFWAYFALGWVVYFRLCQLRGFWMRRVVDAGLALNAGLWVIMKVQQVHADPLDPHYLVYDHLATAGVFAVVLILLRPLDRFFTLAPLRPLAWLGAISYSLYLIHQCNLTFAAGIANRVISSGHVVLNGIVQVAIHVALAAVFWVLCERPFLNKPLKGRGKIGAASHSAPASPLP